MNFLPELASDTGDQEALGDLLETLTHPRLSIETSTTTPLTDPTDSTMHTRGSTTGYVAQELVPFGRGTVNSAEKGANSDKENVSPAFSPAASNAVLRRSPRHSAGEAQQVIRLIVPDDNVAYSNLADRIKGRRRSTTKTQSRASSIVMVTPAPEFSAEAAVTALAGFHASPSPAPTSADVVHLQMTSAALITKPADTIRLPGPSSSPKRKANVAASSSLRKFHRPKNHNQYTPREQLSQSADAISSRHMRASHSKVLAPPSNASAPPQSSPFVTDHNVQSQVQPDEPTMQVETVTLPARTPYRKPEHKLSQTPSAINKRLKRLACIAVPTSPPVVGQDVQPQTQPSSTMTPTHAKDKLGRRTYQKPEHELSQTPKAIFLREQRRASANAATQSAPQKSLRTNSAPAPFSAVDVSGFTRSQANAQTRLLSAPATSKEPTPPPSTAPPALSRAADETTGCPGRITAGTRAEIARYTKPGEDLDWTKETDQQKRTAMQKRVQSRKGREKKKLAAKSDALKRKDTVDVAIPSPSKRVRLEDSAGTPKPREAQRFPVQLPPHRMTKEEALGLRDHDFITAMKEHLDHAGKGNNKSITFAVKQARRIATLLNIAEPWQDGDALEVSGEEAKKYLAANNYFSGPIFTKGQQGLPLQSVEQFLAECYDDEADVYVQDPSVQVAKGTPHVRLRTMAAVKERFAKPASDKPWNLLELAAHVEDGLRPEFLSHEDCRLLTKLKFPSNADKASRKGYDPGWKEVEKWALVAQAGALTEPHQDSHGYSTYITVNEGRFGYGWLSNPTPDEKADWARTHDSYIGGRWRYAVMRPGQTVFFPAGTVHFVFRLPAAGNTLAFGGHVLRCSQIVRWIKCLIDEKRMPNITNEDLTVSAPGYLDRVDKFVKQALKSGQEEKWGGREGIEEFLRLKREFECMKKK